MSSTERAPEPTMEDILASIRRIITDDETGKAPGDKSAATAQTEDEGLEGEADNQIIDDIARVLSSSGDAPANEDEEIMDLTGELGGLELVEDDQPEELLATAEVVDTTPEFVDETKEVGDLLELDDVQPDDLQPDIEVVETVELVETVEVVEFAEPTEAAPQAEEFAVPAMPTVPEMPPVPAPEVFAQVEPEAPKLSASDEAASALERAIAALKAGQSPSAAPAPAPSFEAPVPSFEAPAPSFEAAADMSPEPLEAEFAETPTGFIPLPGDMPMAVPMDSPAPESETHLDPEADATLELEPASDAALAPESLEFEAEGEAEQVLSETETEDTTVLEEAEPESAPFWPPQDFGVPPAEPEPAPVFTPPLPEITSEVLVTETNGVASHETPGSKTLEDSIKEMLRPMLREWLNENMPRMIREELDSDAVQRSQD